MKTFLNAIIKLGAHYIIAYLMYMAEIGDDYISVIKHDVNLVTEQTQNSLFLRR